MTSTKEPENPLGAKELSVRDGGRLDPILGRIDLIAILVALLSACLLGIVAAVLAVIGLAHLISDMWSDPFDRWLLLVAAAAFLWVVARRKKLCVF